MRISRLLITVLTSVFCFHYLSCKKTDIKVAQTQDLEIRFLTVPANAPNAVKRIAKTIKKQNENFHFLNEFIKKQGFARWDKSPIISKPVGLGTRNQTSEGDTIVIVPLVKIDSTRVTAFLACRVTNDSVNIKLYRADRFAAYPRSNSTDSLTSTFVAHQIMVLDYITFGYNTFKITDQRIFDYPNVRTASDSSRFLILKPYSNSNKSSRNASFILIETCWEEYIPPYGYQTGGTPPGGSNDYGHYEVRCMNYAIYSQNFYPDGPGPGSTSPYDPNNGGGGTNTSGGVPYFWNTTPCEDPNGNQTPDGTPCNGQNTVIGWQPIPLTVDWFNALPPYSIDVTGLASYPCAQNIAQSVIQLNNSTIQIIKDVFSESVKYNIFFDVDQSLAGTNTNGHTTPNPTYIPLSDNQQGPLVQIDMSIHLNPDILTASTKLYIAETIIHEMIHSYFFYRSNDANGDPIKTQKLAADLGFLKPWDPSSPASNYGNQHEQMATTYIQKIVAALKEYKLITDQDLDPLRNTYFPGATLEDFYTAMAWEGLTTANGNDITMAWHTFKEQKPIIAVQYSNIMNFERLTTTVAPSKEKCN